MINRVDINYNKDITPKLLTIKFNNVVFGEYWMKELGKFQTKAKEADNINFNFSEVSTIIDDLPFLSIMLEIDFFSDKVIKMTVNDTVHNHLKRFGHYNLLKSFKNIEKIITPQGKRIHIQDNTVQSKNLILSPKLYNIQSIHALEKIKIELNSIVKKFIYSRTRRGAKEIYTIQFTVHECLTNILEHAYPNTDNKKAVIFISKRDSHKDVETHSNLIGKRIVDSTDRNYIELYILDRGQTIPIALKNQFKELLDEKQLDEKQIKTYEKKVKDLDFRSLANNIFAGDYLPNRTKLGKTLYGGLYHIGDKYNHQVSYLIGYSKNAGIISRKVTTETSSHILIKPEFKGTYWHSIISMREIDGIVLQPNSIITELYQEILRKKKESNPSIFFEDKLIIDRRFNKDRLTGDEKSNQPHNLKYIYVFDNQNYSKSEFLNVLINIVDENQIEKNNLCLKILDINDDVFDMIDATFNNSGFYIRVRSILKRFNKIVLLSNSLLKAKVLVWDKSGNTLVEDGLSKNINLLRYTMFSMKNYDSDIFWKSLKNNSMLDKTVQWSQKEKIHGFLDFQQAISYEKISKLLNFVLNRSLCLNYPNIFYVKASDLTDYIVKEINYQWYLSRRNNKLYVGSVIVTGDSHEYIKSEKIYFFVHEDCNKSYKNNFYSLLFWNSEKHRKIKDEFDRNPIIEYERIGKKPYVAKHGWQYFRAPHNDKIKNRKVYESDTINNYEVFQNNIHEIVKFSNYNYDGVNDFIKIDFINALNYYEDYFSQEEKNLLKFLIHEFAKLYFYLTGKVPKFNIEKKDSIKFIKDVDEQFFKDDFYENIKLVVYPPHFFTTKVVNYIFNYFDELTREKLSDVFVPITTKFISKSKPNFINPLSLELIERKLLSTEEQSAGKTTSQQNNKILFFDTCITSGRTRTEIKHSLFGLGMTEMKTLVILDRCRLPLSTPNPWSYKSFWRLDFPSLSKNNPIKIGLESLLDLKNNLIEQGLQERIGFIYSRLQLINLSDDDYHIGFSDISLSKTFERKFPHLTKVDGELIENNNNTIRINTLFGLNLYLTELNIISGREDKILDYLTEGKYYVDDINAEMFLISSFLLLNFDSILNKLKKKLIERLAEIVSKISPDNKDNEIFSGFAITILIGLYKNSRYSRLIRNIINRCKANRDLICFNNDFNILFLNVVYDTPESLFYFEQTKIFSDFQYLQSFKRQFLNQSGHIHNSTISKIASKRIIVVEKNKNDVLNTAENELMQLIRLFDKFDKLQMKFYNFETNKRRSYIVKPILDSIKENLKYTQRSDLKIPVFVSNIIALKKNLENYFQNITLNLFDSSSISKIEGIINKLIESKIQSGKYQIRHYNQISALELTNNHIFIVKFNIYKELIDGLMSNVIHSKNEKMDIYIQLTSNYLIFQFKNIINIEEFDSIQRDINSRNAINLMDLKKAGGKVQFSLNKDYNNSLITSLLIPILNKKIY